MNKNIKGTIFALLGGICWGMSGIAAECLLSVGDITSRWLAPARLLTSGIIMMICMLISKKGKIFDVWKDKRDALDILIYAIVGIMLCQFTYFYTIEHSNASTATILQYTSPVMVMTANCIIKKRKPYFSEILCVVLAIGGVFVIASGGNINSLAISEKALASGLLSAFTVMVYSMLLVRLMKKYSTFYLLAWALVIGGGVLTLMFRPWTLKVGLSIERIMLVGVTVLIGSVLGFSLSLKGIKYIGPTKATILSSVEPISTAIMSVFLLHARFTACDFVGLVLIIVAVILVSVDKKTEKE